MGLHVRDVRLLELHCLQLDGTQIRKTDDDNRRETFQLLRFAAIHLPSTHRVAINPGRSERTGSVCIRRDGGLDDLLTIPALMASIR